MKITVLPLASAQSWCVSVLCRGVMGPLTTAPSRGPETKPSTSKVKPKSTTVPKGWVWNQFFVLEEHMGWIHSMLERQFCCNLFSLSWEIEGCDEVELELDLKRYGTSSELCYRDVISYSEHFEIMITKKWTLPSMSHLHKHQFIRTKLNFLSRVSLFLFSHVKCKHFKHLIQ